ncbi:hypothetical protein HN992_00410 [Candidatus Woesearchaeota archaeon]|jgi:UDP-N-acetylglucosamine--dolichyl-phosphate N-acetylglucosaminephosphotransferase|nr:hypothetical protein [Candidatus Woesearchaeota archaeon]MBT4208130.1 hypothetical protein [Candidatus Woesearchaeota archaeon]MBT4732936.1 hypothetical protein [Candidatus Woesearchaeota archaeon]MBT5112211.1 hypothetical protein [Candidatus Woesearchaeota archaeon]MBT5557696.1 hypothetical protein [Candidatus Woesearchaeota archaeon]
MSLTVFICALIGAFVTYRATPWLARYLTRIDLVVKDQNKKHKPLIPISGGLAVFSGFFIGSMVFLFLRTFLDTGANYQLNLDNNSLVFLFAGLISIFIATLIGFLDDLIINSSKEKSTGLKQWQKPMLTLVAAVPLMVVNAGTSVMSLPIIGEVNWGMLYPLLLVPIGFVGAANMVNMLAGFNGLETGMGIVYFFSLGLYSYVHGSYIATLIALMAFASLCAFWMFNKYPAKILPGDSLTYFLGGTLAVVAILGNIERAALIISIPFFIEFILKAKANFNADTYGVYVNGKIRSKYEEIYSIPHLLTKTGNFTEKQIVYTMIAMQFFFSALIWII